MTDLPLPRWAYMPGGTSEADADYETLAQVKFCGRCQRRAQSVPMRRDETQLASRVFRSWQLNRIELSVGFHFENNWPIVSPR